MIAPLLLAANVLTLDQALAAARAQQPQLHQAQAQTAAAAARSDEALAPMLPQVNGNANYSRATANVAIRPGTLPSGIASSGSSESWQTFGFYNFGVSASQLIYDFGQTGKRRKAAQASEQAQRTSEQTTMAQVVFNVRTAFFQARAAKGLVDVQKETLADQQKHLEQTQGFVDIGTQPEIALAQSKTGVANARVQLIVAENGYEAAKAALNQAMGVEGSLDYDVADDSLPEIDGESAPADALLDEAIRTRPELAVLASQIRAQELTVRSIQGEYGPTLGFTTGFTDAGREFNNLSWNWSAGLGLTIPIYQGGQTKAQVREARANLSALQAQADIERLQVRLDVEQALLTLRAAKEAIVAAEEALVNARAQLTLAEGRYNAGVGSIIELTDAQVAYTSAGQQRVQADYGLAQARAQLLKAVGRS
jgi:outer membrane protein